MRENGGSRNFMGLENWALLKVTPMRVISRGVYHMVLEGFCTIMVTF